MTSTQLASLSKPFTTNATASDLVKLANSAGGEYDPTNKAGSTLPPALRQLYQTQTLSDDTVKAKPGVPDPTKMKVPEANFLDLNGDLLDGNIAGGDLTNTPMGGDAKTAGESAYGFTPDTTLKDVPGATITNESGTLTKPIITDKATADALHKAEQDRIAKEAADKAEAAKKALYYNADGTLTGLGFYTYNPTGNYQDYLDKIAADKAAADKAAADKAAADKAAADKAAADKAAADKAAADKAAADKAAADTSGITSLVTNTTMPKTRGPKGIVDPALEARLRAADQLDTQRRIAQQTAAAEVARGIFSDSRGKEDSERLIFALDNNLDPTQRFMPEFDKLFYASKNPTVVGGLGNDSIKSGMGTDNITSGNTGAVGVAGKSDADIGAQLLNQNQNGFVQNTALLSPGKLYTPELDAAITQQKQQGAVGIAGNPNVNSFTSPDNMNTSATGVGAPITSLLTPNTGASGTPAIQNTGVANQQVMPKNRRPKPVVTTPY
jgi:hypothetical protein